MKFITGDDTGLLKLVHVDKKRVEKLGKRFNRGDAAERLCWSGPSDNKEAQFTVAHSSGAIEARDPQDGRVLRSASFVPGVRRLDMLDGRLLAVAADGSGIVQNWSEIEDPGTAIQFALPAPIADAQVDPCNSARLVIGGEENDVKIWDLERSEVSWRGKNVCENHLCVRVPVRITCVNWATAAAPGRSLILTGSKDGRIRVYDSSAQRKPLFEHIMGSAADHATGAYTGTVDDIPRPVMSTSLSFRGDGYGFFVGNTMGVLREYDLRKLPTCTKVLAKPGRKAHAAAAKKQIPFRRGYRGITGSIRDVQVHPGGEVLVAVGLGRFAYIFSTKKRDMLSKVYLKQKLKCVLFSEEKAVVPDSENEDDDSEGADNPDGPLHDELEEGFSDDGEAPVERPQQEDDLVPENLTLDGDGDEEAEAQDCDAEDEKSSCAVQSVRRRGVKKHKRASSQKATAKRSRGA